MRAFDLRPTLAEIRIPSIVAYGHHDRLVAPEDSLLLASLLPRCRAQEFSESGHAPFLEQQHDFNRLVARFAGRRLGRPQNGRSADPAATIPASRAETPVQA